ncbi:hypothetical protein FPV67DRAFT_1412022 [Lyophyllum atratum]|nr:hypothetical protein FPV67DRAFT_1412022 [Lyophyllum atratum]
MTSVLLALWYAAQGAYALPLPPFVKIDGPSPCNDLEVCRSISDIVWSCLGTILACTWVAIHPNIAAPSENFMARRAKIFVVALIAPELIVLWAFRQRLAARRLTRKFKEFGWTTTHSFFALMGGFTVSTDTQPLSTLDPDALEPYLRNHDIDVTEEEIWDKSKGDALAKSLVVLQVVWFILQLLARAIENFPSRSLNSSLSALPS